MTYHHARGLGAPVIGGQLPTIAPLGPSISGPKTMTSGGPTLSPSSVGIGSTGDTNAAAIVTKAMSVMPTAPGQFVARVITAYSGGPAARDQAEKTKLGAGAIAIFPMTDARRVEQALVTLRSQLANPNAIRNMVSEAEREAAAIAALNATLDAAFRVNPAHPGLFVADVVAKVSQTLSGTSRASLASKALALANVIDRAALKNALLTIDRSLLVQIGTKAAQLAPPPTAAPPRVTAPVFKPPVTSQPAPPPPPPPPAPPLSPPPSPPTEFAPPAPPPPTFDPIDTSTTPVELPESYTEVPSEVTDAVQTQPALPSEPKKLFGIPVLYVGIGGAAVVGAGLLYAFTRKAPTPNRKKRKRS